MVLLSILSLVAATAAGPLVVSVEDASSALEPAKVRSAIAQVCSREALDAGDPHADKAVGHLLVQIRANRSATLLYRAGEGGRLLIRHTQLPTAPSEATQLLAFLASALVTDVPALEPAAAEDPISAPSATLSVSTSPQTPIARGGEVRASLSTPQEPLRNTWAIHAAPGAGVSSGYGVLLLQLGVLRRYGAFALGTELTYGFARSTWGLGDQPFVYPEHRGMLSASGRYRFESGRLGVELGLGIGAFFAGQTYGTSHLFRPTLAARLTPALTWRTGPAELFLQPEWTMPLAWSHMHVALSLGARWWVL